VSPKTGSGRVIRATKSPETHAVRPKIPRKPHQTSPSTSSCMFGKAHGNWPGSRKSAPSVCYSPRKRPETAVSANTRRSCSSRPGEVAREVSYRHGAASTSNLRKSCRDREGFREPENRLGTGDTGHEKPRKGPETPAVRPKIPRKPRQTSPTTSSCMVGKAPRKLARVPKIGPEGVL
jgi:hypothetical protein